MPLWSGMLKRPWACALTSHKATEDLLGAWVVLHQSFEVKGPPFWICTQLLLGSPVFWMGMQKIDVPQVEARFPETEVELLQ